jgi:tripartite-type tricarboxylate transporter receptor subunit TctC
MICPRSKRCRDSRSTAGWWWWRRRHAPDIVARLNREIGQFLQGSDVQQRLIGLGLAIGGTDTPATTDEFIRQQQAQWRSLAQELDLRPE